MKSQIVNYIRAGYPGLYITTHEESRLERDFTKLAKGIQCDGEKVDFTIFAWSITEGIVQMTGDGAGSEIADTQSPIDALEAIRLHDTDDKGETTGQKIPNRSIILLRDFHLFFNEPNPMIMRKLKDALAICKATNRVIVVLGCQLKMQPEIEKCFVLIDYKLPDREQLFEVLEEIAASAKIKLNGHTEKIIDSARGLTTTEAEDAFALSIVECGDVDPEIVYREKAATVKRNGLLEIVENKISLDDIGGLENLKGDLREKSNLFSEEARKFGLPTPRGLLVVGQPGTGKSLTATATSDVFGIPLLKLEAGRIFGSLVGESERNWRTAFATARAVAPCILWIDEVDGLFSGGESSGRTDGGTQTWPVRSLRTCSAPSWWR